MNKLITLLLLASTFWCNQLNAQDSDWNATADFISATYGYNTYSICSPCDTTLGYYHPVSIAFQIEMKNNSDKKYYLIGSDTRELSRGQPIEHTKDKIQGEFYLINDRDSMLLFCRQYITALNNKSTYLIASIDHAESFSNRTTVDFLCQFESRNMLTSNKKIFKYLEDSKIIYIPHQKDYELVIDQHFAKKRHEIAFPKHVINVLMPDSLYLVIGYSDPRDDEGWVISKENMQNE